jgi:hypothetical protein
MGDIEEKAESGIISRLECSLCKDGLNKINEVAQSESVVSFVEAVLVKICSLFLL